ncbi:MAG TPA: hypothetical protein VFM96_02905 [Gaiellaceae bacterium]|nr:hypothetical protein [Gaiellaceae bacterium]
MTLVLAIKATDGVVLASDSQATSGAETVRTRGAARKLDDLHGSIAFGCSGDSGLRQRVVSELRARLTELDCAAPLEELRPRIRDIINPIQQQARAEHVPLDGTEPACLATLFAAVTGGRPWIYEVSADGKDEEHDPAEAIGVSRHYAIHGMLYNQHLGLDKRPMQQVRLAAYRIVMSAIAVDGTGNIGIPVQIYEVRANGVQIVSDEELKVIHLTLNGLKEQEGDLWRDFWREPDADASDLAEELVGGIQIEKSD